MPPEENEEKSPLKQIRTFQGDVANALSDQKESLFSIREVEHLKQSSGGSVPNTTPDDTDKRAQFYLLIIGTFFFLGLGALGAWFGYREFVKKTAPPVIVAPESRLLPAQSEVVLNLASSSRDTLIAFIAKESAGLSGAELKHFILRKGSAAKAPLATTAELLKTLESQAPSSLVRAYDPLFMLGTLGEHRFLIIKLISFENAFAGMLTWEKTLGQDLGGLFVTAPLLKTITPESVFKDVTYRNKDVRILSSVGTTTEPILLYSFFDNKMLIVTDSLETLKTLMDRLTQELLTR